MFTEKKLSALDKETLLSLLKQVSSLFSKEDSPALSLAEAVKRIWETEKEEFIKTCVEKGMSESHVRAFTELAVSFGALNLN